MRELNEIGGAGVEDASVARELINGFPRTGLGPEQLSSPGMVPHEDKRGVVPLIALLEDGDNRAEIVISKGEIVDIGGVVDSKSVGTAVPNAWGMGDGRVQEDKVVLRAAKCLLGGNVDVHVVGVMELAFINFVGCWIGAHSEEER